MQFKELHNQDLPFLLCNVWDVASAKVAENLGFKAIGTSSAAIASSLGYEDGEEMSFNELLFFVKRIAAVSSLPLTVDMEAGYGQSVADITHSIAELAKLGVVGINIEDSIVKSNRTLVDKFEFSRLIKHIADEIKKLELDIFLNIRTDTFLLGVDDVLQESLERIKLYDNAGANGVFIPCITAESDISTIIKSSNLPLNVMCMPELPDFSKLKTLGVKRISMGNFLYGDMYKHFESKLQSIIEQQSFSPLF